MKLEPGDIVATKPRTGIEKIATRLQNLMMTPPSDRYHFFILWQRVEEPDKEDWVILESIPRGSFLGGGLSTGTLALYEGWDLAFYRVDCPADLRHQAPWELVKNYARAQYDWLLVPKLLLGAISTFVKKVWREHRIRKLRVDELPGDENNDLICTESVAVAFATAGVNVIPPGTIATPSSFRQAEIEGRIRRIEPDF